MPRPDFNAFSRMVQQLPEPEPDAPSQQKAPMLRAFDVGGGVIELHGKGFENQRGGLLAARIAQGSAVFVANSGDNKHFAFAVREWIKAQESK